MKLINPKLNGIFILCIPGLVLWQIRLFQFRTYIIHTQPSISIQSQLFGILSILSYSFKKITIRLCTGFVFFSENCVLSLLLFSLFYCLFSLFLSLILFKEISDNYSTLKPSGSHRVKETPRKQKRLGSVNCNCSDVISK